MTRKETLVLSDEGRAFLVDVLKAVRCLPGRQRNEEKAMEGFDACATRVVNVDEAILAEFQSVIPLVYLDGSKAPGTRRYLEIGMAEDPDRTAGTARTRRYRITLSLEAREFLTQAIEWLNNYAVAVLDMEILVLLSLAEDGTAKQLAWVSTSILEEFKSQLPLRALDI